MNLMQSPSLPSVEMAQEALQLGASDYIPKPFDSKMILDAISSLLSK